MAKLLSKTTFLYLVTFFAVTVVAQTDTNADADTNVNILTWTKSGIRYRPRSVTVQPATVTMVETQTILPTATLQLRSVSSPPKRSVKRAFLNTWSYQGCIAHDDNLLDMTAPFPYQLSAEEVSGASCMDFCDRRGSSLAALQNGSECWCGDEADFGGVTMIEKERCDVPCAGQPGEMCGGKQSLSVYSKAG